VGEGVPELVWMQIGNTGLLAPALKQVANAVLGQRATLPQPQRLQMGELVTAPDWQIAVERHSGLPAERQRALAAALAEYPDHVVLEVDPVQPHVDQLGMARAGVDEEHDQRGVAAGLKVLAGTDHQEPLKLLLADHRHRPVRNRGRLELSHRMRELLLVLEPAVEGVQTAVAVVGGRSLAPAQQIDDEPLDVLPTGLT
jgi:hypothetical protein